MIVAPSGNSACLRLFSVHAIPRASKRFIRPFATASSCTSRQPRKAATISAVKSSAVGPRPPVPMIRSPKSRACSKAQISLSRSSPTFSTAATLIPAEYKRSAITAELVSTTLPVVSSSPVLKITAVFIPSLSKKAGGESQSCKGLRTYHRARFRCRPEAFRASRREMSLRYQKI